MGKHDVVVNPEPARRDCEPSVDSTDSKQELLNRKLCHYYRDTSANDLYQSFLIAHVSVHPTMTVS